jgi:hypothetical protein
MQDTRPWLSLVRNIQNEMREAGNPNPTWRNAMIEAVQRRGLPTRLNRRAVKTLLPEDHPIISYNINSGIENSITFDKIQNGNIMVNFHGEKNLGRYYKKSTYNALANPKRNPHTRKNINKNNLTIYKAKVGGSRRRKRTFRRKYRK